MNLSWWAQTSFHAFEQNAVKTGLNLSVGEGSHDTPAKLRHAEVNFWLSSH